MEVTNQQPSKGKSSVMKYKDESEGKHMEGPPYRTHCGLCCVCRTIPLHSRTYYGHLFCTGCFHKYIWSPTKRECSGDVHSCSGELTLSVNKEESQKESVRESNIQ